MGEGGNSRHSHAAPPCIQCDGRPKGPVDNFLPEALPPMPRADHRSQDPFRPGGLRPHRGQPLRGAAPHAAAPNWWRCATPPRGAGRRGAGHRRARASTRCARCWRQPAPTAWCWPRPAACIRAGHRGGARRHRHVMTEKPMATAGAMAWRWCAPATRRACKLFVVKQNRRNRTLQLLKQAVEQGPLRPHLHGQRQRLLDAPAELLRQRPGAAPGNSTAAPS
jgi:hypothetical protein